MADIDVHPLRNEGAVESAVPALVRRELARSRINRQEGEYL